MVLHVWNLVTRCVLSSLRWPNVPEVSSLSWRIIYSSVAVEKYVRCRFLAGFRLCFLGVRLVGSSCVSSSKSAFGLSRYRIPSASYGHVSWRTFQDLIDRVTGDLIFTCLCVRTPDFHSQPMPVCIGDLIFTVGSISFVEEKPSRVHACMYALVRLPISPAPIRPLSGHCACPFVQTSALDASGVDSAFQRILTEIYRLMSRKTITANTATGPDLSRVCGVQSCFLPAAVKSTYSLAIQI